MISLTDRQAAQVLHKVMHELLEHQESGTFAVFDQPYILAIASNLHRLATLLLEPLSEPPEIAEDE